VWQEVWQVWGRRGNTGGEVRPRHPGSLSLSIQRGLTPNGLLSSLTYRDAARQETVDIQLSYIDRQVSDSCLEDADRGAGRGLRDKPRQSGGTATDNHC